MGCTSSSLNKRRPPGRKSSRRTQNVQKQAICVVGSRVTQRAYFSQERSKTRVRSWSPEETGVLCDEAVLILENEGTWSLVEKDIAPGVLDRKQTSEDLGNFRPSPKEGEEKEEGDAIHEAGERHEGGGSQEDGEGRNLQRRSSDNKRQPFLPMLRLLESPPKLCPEQERRLRCINLEVPAGLTDLNSDDSDDDEADGFEFAKLEGSPISCGTEEGTATPFLPGRCSTNSDGLTTDTSFSENWERSDAQGCCSISEPELEVLISPDSHIESHESSLVLSWSLVDCQSSSVDHSGALEDPLADGLDVVSSPGSALGVQVSSSAPFLEKFPSDSFDQSRRDSSLSEGSLFSPSAELSLPSGFFPGFVTYSSLGCSSSSLSSASFSDSYTASFSPRNGSVGDPLNESCRVEELPSATLNSEWALPPIDVNWGELSSGAPKWEPPSPSGSALSQWDHPSPSETPYVEDTSQWGALIPGLPNDLAQLCLMRVPFIKYDPSFRMVCRQWRAVLSSEEFFKVRTALGVQEAHISFVVHGNRVQVFSLQTHKWFCLPPLPRDDGNVSPDWGIDPYDWWQIDTVAVSDGTLFVIGGDQAEVHSFTRPSKPTNRVHKYDFCRNRWIPVSPMQVPRSHAAAVSLGKWIYVAGGSEDREEGASAEVYDFEQNLWSFIPTMNSSMRMCVGMEHEGCFYVKGENTGPGSRVEGEIFDTVRGRWERMSSGMRRGLERGPIASSNSNLFVADWKDSLLKMYDLEHDSWTVVAELPARISRLVGHANRLYGLTGKIKVDPYNHHVISDAPAEVWRLDLGRGNEARGGTPSGGEPLGVNTWKEDVGQLAQRRLHQWEGVIEVGSESIPFQRERGAAAHTDMLNESKNGVLENPAVPSGDYVWECLWRDPKQMIKTGGLAWVPCIAHCTLFED